MDHQYRENGARNIYSNYNQMRAHVECSPNQSKPLYLREVSFFTRRGAPEHWGDQVLFLRSKGGSKYFFKLKRGDHLYFFKKIQYFVKHFRTQMEFLLILQRRCSFDSVSCWNSSKRG